MKTNCSFYAEGLNRPFTPWALPRAGRGAAAVAPALGETAPRPWAAMQPYFYHDTHYRRRLAAGRCPQRRQGTYCPAAARQMVQLYGAPSAHRHRGAGRGDRWHLICVQEGVLFSYLEEPRTNVNIRHKPGAHSPELDAWIAADPESHFARFTPEQKAHPDSGHNFVFCPALRERRTEP